MSRSEGRGAGRVVGPGFHERVYEVVSRVPPGRVTTFGDVAAALGARSVARHVGFALAALPDGRDVPWQRVVTSTGRLPRRSHGGCSPEQVRRLQAEGVRVTPSGGVEEFSSRRVRSP